jgi:hypothetical protein
MLRNFNKYFRPASNLNAANVHLSLRWSESAASFGDSGGPEVSRSWRQKIWGANAGTAAERAGDTVPPGADGDWCFAALLR